MINIDEVIKFSFIPLIVCLIAYANDVRAAQYNDAELDNLFTSKKQRADIDSVRAGKSLTKKDKAASKVKLSGYMTRSDGKSVVWVNNGNTLKSSKVDGLKVYSGSVGKNKQVTISSEGKRAKLKPGETWQKESGKISDSY